MKSEFIKTEEPKDFKPFTIKITAETIEDARLLWHLYNIGTLLKIIQEDKFYWRIQFDSNISEELNHSTEMWEKINEHIESQGFSIYKK